MPDITDEQIDDLMREAGMEEIEEADYRHGQGEQMTISEQERLDAARKFARLVLALQSSASAVPGWKPVPVEPTAEMRAVLRNERCVYQDEGDLYAALLAVSPPL